MWYQNDVVISFVERVNQGESLVNWLNWLTEHPAVCWSVIMGDLSPSSKGVYWTHPEAFRTGPPSCPVQGMAIPACITARASRTCRDACRDRLPSVTGKTFPAFPAHAHPQFCVSGKMPIVRIVICVAVDRYKSPILFWNYIYMNVSTTSKSIIWTPHGCPSQMNENIMISNSKLKNDSELIWSR